MTSSYESNEPSSSDKLKSLVISHLEAEISKLEIYKNICLAIINNHEVETRKFFLFKSSKKRKMFLNTIEYNKNILNSLEKFMTALEQCVDALNNNKVHPDTFSLLNACDLTLGSYRKYLNDKGGLISTPEGNLIFKEPDFGKVLMNTSFFFNNK